MIKIGVVEDDNEQLDVLLEYIKKYFVEHGYNYTVEVFGTATAFQGRKERDFDIIFMDIMLPDGNGWELVKELREKDKNTIIIFTTNMLQYAVKGYEVRAFDFIVKPISYYNFALNFPNALECLERSKDVEIWIKNGNGQRRLLASQIVYVEVMAHYLTYHTTEGKFTVLGSIGNVAKELQGASFSFCNRCYLVNLKYVTQVTSSQVLVNGESLQISRRKYADFLRDLNDYLGGGN